MSKPKKPAVGEPLSERERQVLGLVVEGLREKQIEQRLGLHPSTIAQHVYRARHKLGASTLAQAAVLFAKPYGLD